MTVPTVAIAASAGGIESLRWLLRALPRDFGAAVAIVLHLDRHRETHIAEVLGRVTDLPVDLAVAGAPLSPATVVVAPPDRHLLIGPSGLVELTSAPLVHFVRPSADLFFESAAAVLGPAVIGVVVSGSGQDGAMGVVAVHEKGGRVLVEDPQSAAFTGMPGAAVATGVVDEVLDQAELGPRLRDLVAAGAVS